MRLVTRSDFDGLACGTLLLEAGIIDSWTFAHPKDLQDVKERIEIYFEQTEKFKEMVRANTHVEKDVIISDLRGVDPFIPETVL